MTINRYDRQTILPEIGKDGQKRLTDTRMLCIGAGGLGSPALLYLAAAGIGTICVVDSDTVDVSNLQRQILFKTADQGKSKAFCAAAALTELNPEIRVIPVIERLKAANALSLMADYDIVIDGTDNFATKFLINDAAAKLGKPVVFGAINGFEGQAGIFWAAHGPCYRCLYPQLPRSSIPNCAEAGVLGAVAGMIGIIQAQEAIKLALGPDHCRNHGLDMLTGKLFMVDMRTMGTRQIAITKQKNCPTCSKPSGIIVLHDDEIACRTNSAGIISWNELHKHEGLIIIDVREPDEWQVGHHPAAYNVPLSILKLGKIPEVLRQEKAFALYCQRGKRSREACQLLRKMGYSDLVEIDGGFETWPGEEQQIC